MNLYDILLEVKSCDLLNPGYYIVNKEFDLYHNNDIINFTKNSSLLYTKDNRLYIWEEIDENEGEWKEIILSPLSNFNFMALGPINGYKIFNIINRYLKSKGEA